MLTLKCDFCGNEIIVQGDTDEYKRFQRVWNTKYLDKDVKIKLEISSVYHICPACAKKAIKDNI